jgi:hypothetical protein
MTKNAKKPFKDAAAAQEAVEQWAKAMAAEVKAGRMTVDEVIDVIHQAEKREIANRYRKLNREALRLPQEGLTEKFMEAAAAPRNYAEDRRFKNYMKRLAALGADIEARDARGYTPLLAASAGKNITAMMTLVDLGAKLNVIGHDGATPLTLMMHNVDCLAGYLVRKGADLNIPGADGETVLMISARKGYPNDVKYWLEMGADPRLTNRKGQTAYDLVAPDAFKYTEIREMIGNEIARREAERAEFISKLDDGLTLQAPVKMKRLQLKNLNRSKSGP